MQRRAITMKLVDIYANAGDLLGATKSRYGIPLMTEAMDKTARAPEPGRLRVFAQFGYDAKKAYQRYDRSPGPLVRGAMHAKMLYVKPYLVLGSTNIVGLLGSEPGDQRRAGDRGC